MSKVNCWDLEFNWLGLWVQLLANGHRVGITVSQPETVLLLLWVGEVGMIMVPSGCQTLYAGLWNIVPFGKITLPCPPPTSLDLRNIHVETSHQHSPHHFLDHILSLAVTRLVTSLIR